MTGAPTERELEHLHAEMRIVKAIVATNRDEKLHDHCVYCAARCVGRACRQHRDLVQIENRMAA